MPLTPHQRAKIVAITETWIGTPYRGWSRVKGVGVDCGQLLAAVYIEAGHVSADIDLPKDYALHIGQHQASTAYIDVVMRYLREIPESEVQPGDVVVWKLQGSKAYCHAAIVKTWPTYFIHAIAKGVRAGDARSRLLFRKSEKLFFTLKDEYIDE